MRTKQQREATQRCEAGGRAGEHRDGWTDRQGRSYLLNLLVAGRHGRKNATKVKRQGKKNAQSFQNHRGRSRDMSKNTEEKCRH